MRTSPVNKEIGKRLALFRKAAALTQVQLAQNLDISQPLMAHYEAGRRSIPVSSLVPISQLLKISVDDLLLAPQSDLPKRPGAKTKLEKQFLEAQELTKSDQQFISKFLEQFLHNTKS